jgi:hypothetical protein
MRSLSTHAIKLSVVFYLGSLALMAAPISYRHRITLDLPEFARPPRIFHGIDIWDRIRRHQESGGFKGHGPRRFSESECSDAAPAPATTPEPGYEWLLGLLLVGIGCVWRLKRK